MVDTLLNSAGRPTRRNYEQMTENGGVESTRSSRRRTNQDLRHQEFLETIQQINEENREQRSTYFDEFRGVADMMDERSREAVEVIRETNAHIAEIRNTLNRSSSRLDSVFNIINQRFGNNNH